MATNDDSGYNRNPEEVNEKYDPLIIPGIVHDEKNVRTINEDEGVESNVTIVIIVEFCRNKCQKFHEID